MSRKQTGFQNFWMLRSLVKVGVLFFVEPVHAQDVEVLTVTKSSKFIKEIVVDGLAETGEVIRYFYVIKNSGTAPVVEISLVDMHTGFGETPVPRGEALTNDALPLLDSQDLTADDGRWTTLGPGDEITLTWDYTVTPEDVGALQ